VREINDSGDSIVDEGDILEADTRKGMRNKRLLREITGLLPR
jgi:hypothetical protein